MVLVFLGLLWVFDILIALMVMVMMGTMITIISIINSNIFMFLGLVVECLLPTCLVTSIALLIVGPLSSWTVVALVAIAIRLQSANCYRDRAWRGRLRPWEVSHSHKDRRGGRDPRDS